VLANFDTITSATCFGHKTIFKDVLQSIQFILQDYIIKYFMLSLIKLLLDKKLIMYLLRFFLVTLAIMKHGTPNTVQTKIPSFQGRV
jgi:hypothetical protein